MGVEEFILQTNQEKGTSWSHCCNTGRTFVRGACLFSKYQFGGSEMKGEFFKKRQYISTCDAAVLCFSEEEKG